ncbi:MAG: hypothetical protein B6241_03725 [Spirochaetaceae bacterium 4572_59]|nr:MAG: hypothetical protein B6241_03725 [Spirochaetaceae bacterium 4572_59]
MSLLIRPMLVEESSLCASIVCASAIAVRYDFKKEKISSELRSALASDDRVIVAEIEKRVAGFAWIAPRGAFCSAPYLRLIAVDEKIRGAGIGSALLDEFEKCTSDIAKDFFLLVSDFNEQAISFYQKHGYQKTGELPDFARSGITENLMFKRRRR